MSFNFEEIGFPIAKINGGIKNKELLYMSEPSDKDKVKNPLTEVILDKDAKFQPLPFKKIVEKDVEENIEDIEEENTEEIDFDLPLDLTGLINFVTPEQQN